MEHGTTFGTYVAYGVICLFLLIISLVILRTMLMMSLLFISPLRQVWSWVRGSHAGPEDVVESGMGGPSNERSSADELR